MTAVSRIQSSIQVMEIGSAWLSSAWGRDLCLPSVLLCLSLVGVMLFGATGLLLILFIFEFGQSVFVLLLVLHF